MKRTLPETSIAAIALGPVLALAVSCGGESSTLALEEPVRVPGAQFHEGDLPSRADATTPRITAIDTSNRVIRSGQPHKLFTGRTSTDAATVGLRLGGVGTGYWTFVLGAPDPFAGGEFNWRAAIDFGRDIEPGLHPLQLVAFDGNGNPGPKSETSVCVTPPWPDNLNSCDPDAAPPAAVLTLWWDTEVDLDLQLLTPEGKRLEYKQRSTATAPTALQSPRTGSLDRDSNGGCILDGTRRENVVWQEAPQPGTYSVYANLFDACHVPERSVRFSVKLLTAQPTGEGNRKRLVEVPGSRVDGQLLDVDQNGGANIGMYLTTFTFQ